MVIRTKPKGLRLHHDFQPLTARISKITSFKRTGRIIGGGNGVFSVGGLGNVCKLGARVAIHLAAGSVLQGEVVGISRDHATLLTYGNSQGVAAGDQVRLLPAPRFCPSSDWIGRIVDQDGNPLDGAPLGSGVRAYPLIAPPPPAAQRRALGARLETGLKLFNTILPIAQGQRLGLFSGSGIGKSTLIGQFAQRLAADVVVVGLVGERGRELRDFVDTALGPEGLARSVVVVATSDQPALSKRRAAWAAMATAEYFRDQGKQVLLVIDSITRFAEAHREVALAAGEGATMRGYPPSVSHEIMSLCERAGTGSGQDGDITAVMSVLVAGSDMEEPIADIIRGTLDGHIVLDRAIAERGRFPAVDVLASVSRSLPNAASGDENTMILKARKALSDYEGSELMIKAGLYERGTDAATDRAVAVWPMLDTMFAAAEPSGCTESFASLEACLNEGDADHDQ